jgi:hypothetical protein
VQFVDIWKGTRPRNQPLLDFLPSGGTYISETPPHHYALFDANIRLSSAQRSSQDLQHH